MQLLPTGFYLWPFCTTRHKELIVINLGFFQHSHFQRPSLYIFFLLYQLNTKIQISPWMRCHKIVYITFQCENNYVVLTILQISARVRPGYLVLCGNNLACQENGCVWVSISLTTVIERTIKHVNTSKYFVFFYWESNFISVWSWK